MIEQQHKTGTSGKLDLRLKYVADEGLSIWNFVTGFHGALKDLRIIDCSQPYEKVCAGTRLVNHPYIITQRVEL